MRLRTLLILAWVFILNAFLSRTSQKISHKRQRFSPFLDLSEKISDVVEQEKVRLPFNDLILSGGGAKGIAYVPVVETLEEQSLIEGVKYLSGTSAGAIFAALVAFGLGSKELNRIINSFDFNKILGERVGAYKRGVLPFITRSGEPIYRLLKEEIRNAVLNELYLLPLDLAENESLLAIQQKAFFHQAITFVDLETLRHYFPNKFKSFSTNAIDLVSGKEILFSASHTPFVEVASASRASSSIPLVLTPQPIKINKRVHYFVDGGLMINTPYHLMSTPRGLVIRLNQNLTPSATKKKVCDELFQLLNLIKGYHHSFIPPVETSSKILDRVNHRLHGLANKGCPCHKRAEPLNEKLLNGLQRVLFFFLVNGIGRINLTEFYGERNKKVDEHLCQNLKEKVCSFELYKTPLLDFTKAKSRYGSVTLISKVELLSYLIKSGHISEDDFLYQQALIRNRYLENLEQHLETVLRNAFLRRCYIVLCLINRVGNPTFRKQVQLEVIMILTGYLESNFLTIESKVLGGDLVNLRQKVAKHNPFSFFKPKPLPFVDHLRSDLDFII